MRAPLRVAAAIVAAGALLHHPAADAQVRPVYDLGAAGLLQVLERLQTTASVLHVGAHPDDEDSAFLARMARGDNARTAYLSLTRGEGGQNIIGTELFEALGVIRTEELLQARRLDGGDQFFTRAIDYGFSKTRDEAAAKWGEREVLADVVRVIRTFRPLVVTSRFSGTPSDGHGQHQFAGYITPLAFRAAGDRNQFPEHGRDGLRPWAPRLLYVHGGGAAAVEVQTGVFDPVLGRSYAEIALEGRSQHKSQEMGTIERRGPSRSLLRPVEPASSAASAESIFSGLDTTLTGLASLAGLPAGTIQSELRVMADAARRALDGYEPLTPARIVPALAEGLKAARAARAALMASGRATDAIAHADHLLSIKEDEFTDALARAAGLVVDALADTETVVPGASVSVSIRAFYPPDAGVRVTDAAVNAPAGWTVTQSPEAGPTGPGGETPADEKRFAIAVPASAPATEPYFLRQPPQGDRYVWPDTLKAAPFAPAVLQASLTFEVMGATATMRRPVQYRYADRIRGELRRDVQVVPRIALALDSRLLVVPIETGQPYAARVSVTSTSFSDEPVSGTLRLRLPDGWRATPAESPFTLPSRGARASAAFVIRAPDGRKPGRVEIAAEAIAGGATFSSEMQTIAYPHIQTHRLYRPAAIAAQVVDVKVAPVRVGYVMGSGDQVPEAIRRLGVDVTVLDDEMLKDGDLSSFDTIVVGVRASEARPEFPAEHARLLQYANAGGTLIVQYQQYDYLARNLPPFTAGAPQGRGNSRVTVETAPVRILSPEHPVFTFPNRITADDFEGWVQERNLYAFATFDARYTPLLESADPGEPAQQGGQVYAAVGKGHYVYTAYAWFRQLPAGVPGAYRQFANLISLPRAPRIAGSRGAGAAPRTAAAAPLASVRTRPSR